METENKSVLNADNTSIVKSNNTASERPDFSFVGNLAGDLFPVYRQLIQVVRTIPKFVEVAKHPWTREKINNAFTGTVNGFKWGADVTSRGINATVGYASKGTSAAINKVTTTGIPTRIGIFVKNKTLGATGYIFPNTVRPSVTEPTSTKSE